MVMNQGIDDLAALEEAFGLPRNFIENLIKDDDWSLVIKAHALIESACTDMLTNFFGKNELVDIFSHIDMSNKKCGKIAFISALKLLSKPERRFISALSELRNHLVHNASNVNFSLQSYFSSFPKREQEKLLASFNLRLQSVTVNEKNTEGLDLLTQHPKTLIWSSLMLCLSSIYVQDIFAIKRNELINDVLNELKKNGPIEIQKEDIPSTIKPGGLNHLSK